MKSLTKNAYGLRSCVTILTIAFKTLGKYYENRSRYSLRCFFPILSVCNIGGKEKTTKIKYKQE